MIKSLAGDLHSELMALAEFTGRQSTGVMFLIEEDRLSGTMQTPPFVDAALRKSDVSNPETVPREPAAATRTASSL